MEELSAERKRGMLLTALDEIGGSGSTSEIREEVDLDSRHVWNNMDYLRGENLVVKEGKEKSDGGGIDPNIYRLTEMGEAAATRVQQEDGSLSEQIRKEVDVFADLQETVDQRGDRIDELEAEQERMKEKWNGLIDTLEQNGVL